MQRGVIEKTERESPMHMGIAPELPFGGEAFVKEHHGRPVSSKDPAQKEQLPLFKAVQGQLAFGQKLTTALPAPELTSAPPSPQREESIEPAHPVETQEHVSPEREEGARPVEILQPEKSRAVEVGHLPNEELSRYAGWASFYSQHLERDRQREERSLQSKLAEQDTTRRRVSDRDLEEMKSRLDFLTMKAYEAFLLDECYDRACNKRGVKPEPFSHGQRDYLGGRVKVFDRQSVYLAEKRIEIAREKLPAIEQFVDSGFLDLYRKVQERSAETRLLQEKGKERQLHDKADSFEHDTKLLGVPELTDSSKSTITLEENSHLEQQISTVEHVREIAALVR